jgi:transcriptional regulator with GAF, ATPase, and Fis domain
MLLLDVWREVCRHLELQEAVDLIAPLLAKRIPIGGLVVRRLDLNRLQAGAGVGAWLDQAAGAGWSAGRHGVREADARYLFAWANDSSTRRLNLPADGVAYDMLGLKAGASDVIAGVLREGGRLTGLMAVVSRQGAAFDAEADEIAARLLEPLAAAVANHARIEEMTRMREAAEADNRALLTRLARHDLSDAVIGHESGLRDVMRKVSQVAATDAPVLIMGETGSGKEVVARTIHEMSARAQRAVERVNCGAIPPGLVDSELFGHERGSFTGATGTRKGWFERADGGTLFLDEVGELSLDIQVRLLRILQDGTFERVGGQRTQRVDVRIVAATHRDLGEMVRDGKFRKDLWYRLSVFPIHLPPLRDRPEDIPALASHFGYRVGTRLSGRQLLPTPDDLDMLVSYRWPGNVRELAAVIERAAILGNGTHLEIAAALGTQHATSHHIEAVPTAGSGDVKRVLPLDAAMADHIRRALAVTRGRIEGKEGAARLLEINPHTLRARMRKLNVNWQDYR